MLKRGLRDANADADAKEIINEEMMFMGIDGKEMTNLEVLKREEQDLLARQMMRPHQKNSLRGSRFRGSGRLLTLEMSNSYFESSESPHGDRDAGKT